MYTIIQHSTADSSKRLETPLLVDPYKGILYAAIKRTGRSTNTDLVYREKSKVHSYGTTYIYIFV